MKVGDLVTLKGEPHGIIGLIIKAAIEPSANRTIYFVSWVCDMCDDAWGESWELEVVSSCK